MSVAPRRPAPNARPPADDVLAGILDLTAAAPLALAAFASVTAVEWSERITTACVECAHRPRLLLNPGFVEKWCGTRERLAMLVFHELSHISLGHTRLHPRISPAHNVAFDAIINARLLRMLLDQGVDAAPYAELPCDFYAADEAPLFILRPPPGWPAIPDWEASATCPDALRRVHRRLYSPGGRALDEVTCTDVLHALLEAGATGVEGDAGQGGGAEGGLMTRLLGAHGSTAEEEAALSSGRDRAAAELLRATLAALRGRTDGWGPAGGESDLLIAGHRAEQALQRALRRLLRRVFVEVAGSPRRAITSRVPVLTVHAWQDRRAACRILVARRVSAPEPRLFQGTVAESRPDRSAATVYVDVSGSMHGLVERLHAALAPLHRLLAAEVLAFSGDVAPTPVARFIRGEVRTTWGTDITPVLAHASHAAAPPRRGVRRALVLTDGYFAAPAPAAVAELIRSGCELHVAVVGDGPLPSGRWVASATRLPARDPSTSTRTST
jgi:hypothetical protein